LIQLVWRFNQGILPTTFNDTWVTNAVRRDEEGEPEALRNDEDLYIHPARTTQTDSHPLTNFPRTWVSLAEESVNIDICSICNKEEFD
jgi:hypothetical protein